MKIAYKGFALPEGKIKYQDEIFIALAEKFEPAKLSPYYFELLPEGYELADAIAVAEEEILDVLIPDMEKIEGRLSRAEDPAETGLLKKGLAQLEDQKPLCDLELESDEQAIFKAMDFLSFTPTLVVTDTSLDAHTVCRDAMAKAGMMFFYTVGKTEVHAWLVEKNATAVTCAGKIHTDLARGFIKAEIVTYEELMTAHNMQDARTQGLTRLVDRDEPIPERHILDIRFNV